MTKLPKLGIFGDSFAAPRMGQIPSSSCWFDVLRRHYDIENWAVPGSGIRYSYCRFKDHYQKYNKIIFVVSSSVRIWLSNMFEAEHPHWTYTHINGPKTAEMFHNYYEKYFPENIRAVNTLKAAVDYYKYIQNTEVDFLLARTMLQEIKSLSPNTLLVSALYSDMRLSELVGHEHYLNDIALMENDAIGISLDHLDTLDDFRQCHLTDENNLILGEKMLEWLDNNKVIIDLNDFHKPVDIAGFKKKYLRERI